MTTRSWATAFVAFSLLVVCGAHVKGAEGVRRLHGFARRQLSTKFYAEGASAGDFNRDGACDVIAGPFLYWGPSFDSHVEIYPAKEFSIEGYSDNFFAFPHDVDGDGWLDVVSVGFPGEAACWFRNPAGKAGFWDRHIACEHVDNESPAFADLTGDGRPELVFHRRGRFGYAEIPGKNPTGLWRFTPISDDRKYDRFNHGLGVGDLNGDGRLDVLERAGWWEQPADLAARPQWTFHPVRFADAGGAQMLVDDFDGDGDADVVASKAAHAYGLSWFEQVKEGAEVRFVEHSIMGDKPEQNDYGVCISELHALALADVDGDGVNDFVTGKRFWAHSSHDPGALEPPILTWFRTVRDGGSVHFVPYQIDDASGVGTQVVAADLNGDKRVDVIVGNKKGVFAFTQEVKEVDAAAWKAAQPQRLKVIPVAAATSDSQPMAEAAGSPTDAKPTASKAIPAADAAGQPLNLDFETGDLRDWTKEGNAFDQQPMQGDAVARRRGDMNSGHQGEFWIGTYEIAQDGPLGSLTSKPFPVKYPWASFLIGGGGVNGTKVEIVDAPSGEVIFTARGNYTETMHRVGVDLSKRVGREIFIRVVDGERDGWGHINFDDFKFHDEKPDLSFATAKTLTPDDYPYSRISGEEAAGAMRVPDGFSVELCAQEPDVKQPIAMCLDERGRVWIAEAYEYPERARTSKGRDRILIFEDTNGDGKFDKRTVFAEGLNLVSGLEVGFGGVWVGAAPWFMFIPDADGDDRPDGKPQILLDGWGYQDTHETLNTFIWGPDGWLYGCHGVFTHSKVGKPGTPDSQRTPINAGVWRYHPTRHKFEVFSEGTSNPWGVDFDDHGQAFITACVIPHLYHVIQGGRYQRQAGGHFNPYTYDDIKTIADHLHYLGANAWAGNDRSDSVGGGHAHAGAMIYLGGLWPEQFRGKLVMNNIHGQRLNMDSLHSAGSGFAGSHEPDFLLTGDRASQMLNIRYGPDGNAYVIDWYDMQSCHDVNADVHDRSNGRIYKVNYGKPEAMTIDLRKSTDAALAETVLSKNDWYVRHGRKVLQERAAAGKLDPAVRTRLVEVATTNPDDTRRLRAMWALHVTGGLPADLPAKLFADASPYVRAWTIQLLLDSDQDAVSSTSSTANLLPQLVSLAKSDPSPVVRLYVASAAGRLPVDRRWDLVAALVAHGEDADDHNLPLMSWYAAEPLAKADPQRALDLGLAAADTQPRVAQFMARRVGALNTPASMAILVRALGRVDDQPRQELLLAGIRDALRGQRGAKAPAEWASVFAALKDSPSAKVKSDATAIGVAFGDPAAAAALREVVMNASTSAALRREALGTLLSTRDPQLAVVLRELLKDEQLRAAALRGLAAFDDPATPAAILDVYDSLPFDDRQAALGTLASRPAYALELLKAVDDGRIAKNDLSADLVRQLGNLNDSQVAELAASVWGTVRSTPADKAQQVAEYLKLWETRYDNPPDRELGRTIFVRTCQQCHTLYGVGAKIGPDLTGANRADINYLLSNIVDPNALIAKEYQTTVILTVDGRIVSGIIQAQDDNSVTIKNTTETLVVPKEDIDAMNLSDASMMPENQLKQYTDFEVLSLLAYLNDGKQWPMLATKETAELLYNGRDLAGWQGDFDIWTVEGGEIVGRSPGIDRNSFLVSETSADDFRLSFEVKLVDDAGNSGVQFRSKPIDSYHEIKGLQADIGPDWWGKLYEEHGRELVWKESGEKHVKRGEWNRYVVEARGSKIRTWINDQPCVDLEDPEAARRGVFALQMHSGGPTEVRFRELKLEVSPVEEK